MKFDAAYKECRDAVYGYLLYMTKEVTLAEDLSQETFLKMFLHLGGYREASSVKTWALKIAHNTFLSYAKKKRPILLEEQYLEAYKDQSSNDPEHSMLNKERQEEIQTIMMMLKESERTTLLLRDVEGLSYGEIGQILNVSQEVVKSRLYRARQKFRKYYTNMIEQKV